MSLRIPVRILFIAILYNIHGSLVESTNQWAVHITEGQLFAKNIAEELGFKFLGKIIDDHYLFEKQSSGRHRRSTNHHTQSLLSHEKIKWVEHQKEQKRVKRDFAEYKGMNYHEKEISFRDTEWKSMWYLHDKENVRRLAEDHHDLNVMSVWKRGITGKGVIVTILDDGLEHNHTDIQQNYDPKASYDINDDDEDPFPRYDSTNENKHGTRCAGEVAMVANNNKCGVGIAYNANIGGIRLLDGIVTDSIEAKALNFKNDYVHIFSASWGPNDDGETVAGPGSLSKMALEMGVTNGRGGLGVIYVWASGNGGGHGDNCNCDGYTGSIYTLSISSATEHHYSPWYVEQCASTMASTYSSGSVVEKKIVSTDLHDECTIHHTGTSASAPLAAGIFALVLEMNPLITWRDLQHMVAWTSTRKPLAHNIGWKQNAAGFWINSLFGFGILDADGLVNMANPKTFKSVPPKDICESSLPENELLQELGRNSEIKIFIDVECEKIKFLEHVQLYASIDTPVRGKLEVHLLSPSGTYTVLLSTRENDKSSRGFDDWPFMSVHTWGENPNGRWQVTIKDHRKNDESPELKTTITNLKLVLHGTLEPPQHVKESMNHQRFYEEVKMNKKLDPKKNQIDDDLLKSFSLFKQKRNSNGDSKKHRERIDDILEDFLEMIEKESKELEKSYDNDIKEIFRTFSTEHNFNEPTRTVSSDDDLYYNDIDYVYF